MIATFSCLHRCGDVKVVNGKFCVTYDTEPSEPNMERLFRFAKLLDTEKVVLWSSSDLLWFDEVQFQDAAKTVSKGVWQETCLWKLRDAFPAFEVVDLGSMVAMRQDASRIKYSKEFVQLMEEQMRMIRNSNRTIHFVPEFGWRVAATYAAEGASLAKSRYANAVFYTHEEAWIYYANLLLKDGEKLNIRML